MHMCSLIQTTHVVDKVDTELYDVSKIISTMGQYFNTTSLVWLVVGEPSKLKDIILVGIQEEAGSSGVPSTSSDSKT